MLFALLFGIHIGFFDYHIKDLFVRVRRWVSDGDRAGQGGRTRVRFVFRGAMVAVTHSIDLIIVKAGEGRESAGSRYRDAGEFCAVYIVHVLPGIFERNFVPFFFKSARHLSFISHTPSQQLQNISP